MGLIARTPIDVMLGEMAYGVSDATRYADLQAIASVISNRATALGVTPQQVVARQSEFNAYGKGLPPGASAYRDLAEAAWNDIATNGPTHTGMFYATPAAVGNLPKGLREVTSIEGGHRYFEDPHGRAIKTSVGYRAPVDLAATRAAVAQRVAFETAAINGEDFATPVDRPQVMPITQNPALLAGMPLAQVDPNISTGVPDISALTGMPDASLAQQMQSTAFDPSRFGAPASATADSNFAQGMTAQRQQPTPMFDPGRLAAADFQADPAMQDAMRASVERAGQINSPDALQAALSSLGAGIAAQRTVDVQKSDRLAGNVPQGIDPARMADNAPLSAADAALAGMMKEAASNSVTSRFGEPLTTQTGPFSRVVQTTSIPGEVPASSYVPGSMPAAFNTSAVAARSVPTVSITPDMINSPEALSAALSSIGAAPAMAQADVAKGARIGAVDTAGMDQSRFNQVPEQTADAALQAAITQSVNNSPSQPADIGGFLSASAAQRGPTSGVNSAEMQAMQGHLAYEAQKAEAARAAALNKQFPGLAVPNLAQAINPTVPSMPTPSALTASVTDQMPNTAAAAKTSRLPATDEIAQDFAAEVQAGLPAQKTQYDRIREWAAVQTPEEATPEEIQNSLVEAGHVPAPAINPLAPQSIPAAVTEEETPAPALETITVPDLPAVKAVAPTITPTVAKTASSMPAVQQRQSTAMDVWSGKAQTGVATDGSTVSRLSGNKIGRYVPEYDYTVFSQDDGATWSSPVAGNQLTPAKPSSLASIQPARQSLISRLVSVLTGTAPGASPTDIGPSMGLDGGMSVGRDGPAGAGGGWGPGGSISNPGSAGGYGSTNGKDPY